MGFARVQRGLAVVKAVITRVPARRIRILLDSLRGLDFLTAVRPEEVGLDATNVRKSTPSGSSYLERVLRGLGITAQDQVLDVGCGKGSAMRTMLKFPFARIDGLELSEPIAAIARRNFRRLKADRVRVFVGDAARFSDYDAYNVVYLYNPFPASVMSRVIGALIQSLRRSERELVVIYNNAVFDDVVARDGVFARMAVYPSEWGTGICVYSNRHGGNSRLSSRIAFD